MAWDSVPWFIGGGAQHSPEVARLLSFAATSGAQGIVSPSDLKVAPTAVPGGGVLVAPGAALILNRATGGASQTYVARLPVAETALVAPTSSSGRRSDLIVAQIEDPFMSGESWQDPADPAVGPYIFTRVNPNVPAGATRLQDVPGYSGRSAITLARVDLPASTGTVTAAMITDLRALATPRSARQVLVSVPTAQVLTSKSYVRFPSSAPSVTLPDWATHVTVLARVDGVKHYAAVNGDFRVRLGSGLTGTARTFDLESVDYAQTDLSVVAAGSVGSMAGTSQPLSLDARRNGYNNNGRLETIPTTQVTFDLYFEERAV